METIIHHEQIDSLIASIPETFYYGLLGELVSVFGPTILSPIDETYYDFNGGTGGWFEAMRMTCRKLDMKWILEKYHEMPWYDSDTFDGRVEEKLSDLMKNFNSRANPYYKKIISLF